MTGNAICTTDNLFDFFHHWVDAAASHQGNRVSEDGVYYLSNLLVERVRTPDRATEPDTLVELQIEAAQSDRIRAIHIYKRLGDKALYVSGFFPRSLTRRMVSRSYYQEMGAAAYDTLSRLLAVTGGRVVGEREGRRTLDAIYAELAEAFGACSEVLAEVREAIRAYTDTDIVRLYEEWRETGSLRAFERLRELGVIPTRSGECGTC